MSKITGNEPAVGYSIPQNFDNFYDGMTIRQRFAMAAMQGCLASGFETTMQKHAETAVEAADALINELNKSEK